VLLATAHADSVHEFVGALTGSPLRIPLTQAAAFEFVVVMERDGANVSGRRVRSVWRLEPTSVGVEIAEMERLSSPPLRHDISMEITPHHAITQHWFPFQELVRRQHILDDLRERPDTSLPFASLLANSGSSDLDA
jgi:hypothetical protein